MGLRAITTVYSYRHPETRRAIDKVVARGFPHQPFMRSVTPPGALDAFHEPIIDKILGFNQRSVPHLRDFDYRYPTSGSEEGIREVMTDLQAKGIKRIYVFQGEYEGYKAVAEQRCMETVEVDLETNPQSLEAGYWFISNPSAIDGNIIPDEVIARICEAGHQLFYDLAYLGATRPHSYDLSHPNIFAAVISFSKTYGLFYDRIGFAFSRQPVNSLYGNKWFKSIFALMIAEAIVTDLEPDQLAATYKAVQAAIVEEINAELSLGMKPSDAFLLAHITPEDAVRLGPKQLSMIETFKRGTTYRFCLTPYFVERDPEFGEGAST